MQEKESIIVVWCELKILSLIIIIVIIMSLLFVTRANKGSYNRVCKNMYFLMEHTSLR